MRYKYWTFILLKGCFFLISISPVGYNLRSKKIPFLFLAFVIHELCFTPGLKMCVVLLVHTFMIMLSI